MACVRFFRSQMRFIFERRFCCSFRLISTRGECRLVFERKRPANSEFTIILWTFNYLPPWREKKCCQLSKHNRPMKILYAHLCWFAALFVRALCCVEKWKKIQVAYCNFLRITAWCQFRGCWLQMTLDSRICLLEELRGLWDMLKWWQSSIQCSRFLETKATIATEQVNPDAKNNLEHCLLRFKKLWSLHCLEWNLSNSLNTKISAMPCWKIRRSKSFKCLCNEEESFLNDILDAGVMLENEFYWDIDTFLTQDDEASKIRLAFYLILKVIL